MLHGPSKAQFDRIYAQGLSAGSARLRLLALAGEGRFGVAVARKLGCAPVRNRARRRAREAARTVELRPNLDYVAVMKRESAGATLGELQAELAALAGKLNARWDAESESSS